MVLERIPKKENFLKPFFCLKVYYINLELLRKAYLCNQKPKNVITPYC